MRSNCQKKGRGESNLFFFIKKTLPIIIILTDLGSRSQVFLTKKCNKKREGNNYLSIVMPGSSSPKLATYALPPRSWELRGWSPLGAESCDPGARLNGAESWDLFFFIYITPIIIIIIHFKGSRQVFFAKKIKKFFYHMQVPFVKSKIKK